MNLKSFEIVCIPTSYFSSCEISSHSCNDFYMMRSHLTNISVSLSWSYTNFFVFITLSIFIHSGSLRPYLKGKQNKIKKTFAWISLTSSIINEINSRRPWRSNLGLNWLASTKIVYQIPRGHTQIKHRLWFQQPLLDPWDL